MHLTNNIIEALQDGKYLVDPHFIARQRQRQLSSIDIVNAIINGEVIESLKRYNNGEKYIIYCKQDKKIFHIILMYNNGTLLLKTIYSPDDTFETDEKTRKNGNLLR